MAPKTGLLASRRRPVAIAVPSPNLPSIKPYKP